MYVQVLNRDDWADDNMRVQATEVRYKFYHHQEQQISVTIMMQVSMALPDLNRSHVARRSLILTSPDVHLCSVNACTYFFCCWCCLSV